MLLRDRYILKNSFGFFFVLLVMVSLFLLLIQTFWSVIDARHTGVFLYRSWIINFYDSFQIIFPFITILSVFFVFSELERFRQISILQLKGISELQIFRPFLLFGLLCSILSFLIGCFPPYPDEHRDNSKSSGSLNFTTTKVFLWIEKYDNNRVAEKVIFRLNSDGTDFACYCKKAIFSEKEISFYDCFVSINGSKEKYIDFFKLKTVFNPVLLIEYLTLPLERQSFFKLNSILKNISRVGVKSRIDLIYLYSKISYPLLNLFMVMLLIPFLLHRNLLSRSRVFIIAFVFTLLTYAIYSAGLSLGKSEIIAWQISPWLAHLVLLVFFGGYLAQKSKKCII